MAKRKKNLLKVPEDILRRVAAFGGDEVVAAAVLRIPDAAIRAGDFEHVRIRWEGDAVAYEASFIPPSSAGRYSRVNVEGKVIRLTDLPKQEVSWSVTTPNWGDYYNGTHEVTLSAMAYPKQIVPARELALQFELLGEEAARGEGTYVFRVSVDEVLDRKTDDFVDRLLFDLNLLQENVGGHDVYESAATRDDYLATLYVSWEILPPGERDSNIARILEGVSGASSVRESLVERYDFLDSLGPTGIVRGTNGFRRYYGAMFADDLVVFENVEYGNALYIMGENWQGLSQMSRLDLLSAVHKEYIARIVHTGEWQEKLRTVVTQELLKRQQG